MSEKSNRNVTRMITNLDYEHISEDESTNILDNQFKNQMEIIIAECIGSIPKKFFTEYQRLVGYTFYPALNPKELNMLAIDNITSNEVRRQMTERVYKRLESIFESKMISWNSVAQTTAKRFVTNAVEQAVDAIRGKLIENSNNEKQTSNIIIQRFVLINNQLKIV